MEKERERERGRKRERERGGERVIEDRAVLVENWESLHLKNCSDLSNTASLQVNTSLVEQNISALFVVFERTP